MPLTRSTDDQGVFTPRQIGLGAAVAVGVVGVAVVLFSAFAAWYCHRRRQRSGYAPRFTTWTPVKCDVEGSEVRAPGSRETRSSFLSALDPRQRQQRRRTRMLDHKSNELATSPMELDAGESGKAALISKEGALSPYTAPAYNPDRDIGPIAHYQPGNMSSSLWERPGQHNDPDFTMPALTTPQPAAWHSRRTGPPPPILIAPPELSRSPSDAYASYRGPSPPYGYYSTNVSSPLPSVSSNDGFMPDSASSSHSVHSAQSYRSNEPLHAPATPRSLRTVSQLSRHDSGSSRVETPTLLPPTPTYSPSSFSQSQRIPIDTVNFVCLGPLPDNIPLPSPRQFQEQRMQQQQQLSAQRAVTPELQQPPLQQQQAKRHDLSVSHVPPGRLSPTFHEATDLRPQPSPATSIFRERSLRAHVGHVDEDEDDENQATRFGGLRRQSTDSLGSNFTVEEEERIQAQIAKNLAMVGQERVVGTTDLVHIPQISDKRYSWEEV